MTSADQPQAHGPDGMTASVLGEPRKYTRREAAEAAGVSLEFVRRFWRASGYAAVEDDAVELTESDVATLRLLASYVDRGIVSERGILQLSRLMGRTAARLAESQVEAVVERLEDFGVGVDERSAFVEDLAEKVMPDVQFLLGQTWRRHMAAAINRMTPGVDDLRPSTAGVGFADLVGFTDASRVLSETALLDLVERFEDRSAGVIGEHGGRIVKMLGDEVLFTTTAPEELAEIALHLRTAFGTSGHEQGLRVGLAFGPVVRHLGDVFGTTVNLASRLTGLAEPDTILAASGLVEALDGNPAYRFEPRHHDDVRGFGAMTSYGLTRA